MDVSDELLTGNKREAALFFRVSIPTINSWIDKGCPVVEGGQNGVAYKLDFRAVQAWRESEDAKETAHQAARSRAIESAQAELFGPDDLPDDADLHKLSPRQQADLIKARRERLTLLEQQGALVRTDLLSIELGRAILELRDSLRTLPDRIKKSFDLAEDVTQMLIDAIDETLEVAADRIADVMRRKDDAGG